MEDFAGMTTEEAWARVDAEFKAFLWKSLTTADSLFTPLVLIVALAICFAVWLRRRPGPGFFAWLFPARIYRRQGFLLDVQVYVLGILVMTHLALGPPAVAALVAAGIAALAALPPPPQAQSPLAVAIVVFLVSDLLTYWYHRLHHDVGALWPLHALHHSAEELTPLTAARHHPVYVFFGSAAYAGVVGTLQALALLFLFGSVDVLTLLGTNVFYAVFNLAAANLRHSHVWLRYPRWLEHVLISPAQHQVHHSIDPRHHNRNYGEVLAVWDWAFCTLYVPRADETGVEFGLGDAEGRRLEQPHGSFLRAMVVPVVEVLRALRRRPPGREM